MNKKKIAIIGAGHIANALIEGLYNTNKKNMQQIIVANPTREKLEGLQKKFNVQTTTNNKEAVEKAEWIILAVKPQVVLQVIEEIKDIIGQKILVSVAVGVPISYMQKHIKNTTQKIVRVMPNIPIAYNQGVIGFLADSNLSDQEKKEIIQFFSQVGKVFLCNTEEQFILFGLMPACGPALVSYCIEMFAESAKKYELNDTQANEIAMQVFKGTLTYLQKTKKTPKELQDAVATKGGVTERILESLDENGFNIAFLKSIDKGNKKIKEIENKRI